MTAPAQIEPTLFPPDALEHARTLHSPGTEGTVFFTGRPGGKWREWPVPIADVEAFVRDFPPTEELFLTPNRFERPKRKVCHLREADALWVDLDYYRDPELAPADPRYTLDLTLQELERQRIPEPDVAIGSGRGLHVLWIHSPVPPSKVIHWQHAQRFLHETLRALHSDPAVQHPAAVLRVPGTRNAKSGRMAETIRSRREWTWDFDDLFREIVGEEPRARDPTEVFDFEREAARRRKPSSFFAQSRWGPATLWAGRFQEIRALVYHRWPNGIPPGHRDIFLFVLSVGLSWMVEPSRLPGEVTELTRHCSGNWGKRNTDGTATTVLRRAREAANGQKVKWAGQEWDPRYRFRTETLIELLSVSPREARDLTFTHLLPRELQRERDALRKRQARDRPLIQTDIQCNTYRTREEYAARPSIEKERPWEALKISRRAYYYRKAKGEL